jgi:hypothetical protein
LEEDELLGIALQRERASQERRHHVFLTTCKIVEQGLITTNDTICQLVRLADRYVSLSDDNKEVVNAISFAKIEPNASVESFQERFVTAPAEILEELFGSCSHGCFLPSLVSPQSDASVTSLLQPGIVSRVR